MTAAQDSDKIFSLTVSPAVELSLQLLDGVLHRLVLLLLLLVLPLPLLGRQLQVDGGGVPDGLGTVTEDADREIFECEMCYVYILSRLFVQSSAPCWCNCSKVS